MAGNTTLTKSGSSGNKGKSLLRKLLGSGMAGEASDAATRRERRRRWQMNNPSKDPAKHKDEWQ